MAPVADAVAQRPVLGGTDHGDAVDLLRSLHERHEAAAVDPVVDLDAQEFGKRGQDVDQPHLRRNTASGELPGRVVEDQRYEQEVVPERILLHTNTFPNPTVFNEDFAALSPLLVDELAKRGTKLIGIDTPSVDLFDSKDLPAHQSFLRNDMAILEGLVLTDVPDGMYELIALPLKLVGFDASPVRAILRPLT